MPIRAGEGAGFHTNPPPETVITGGSLLIAIGTGDQLAQLAALAAPGGSQAPAGLDTVDR